MREAMIPRRSTASPLVMGLSLVIVGFLLLGGCSSFSGPTHIPETTNPATNSPLVESLFKLVTNPAIIEWLIKELKSTPKLGQYYQGRTLTVSVSSIERFSELRYSTVVERQVRHVRLLPSEDGWELVVVHLKVANHTATSAIFNVDRQGAELRDFQSNKYFPIDVGERARNSSEPPILGSRSSTILELQPDGTFSLNKGFLTGPFELLRGMGIDGWIIFEAPEGTKFREFKWRAGDSLTISF